MAYLEVLTLQTMRDPDLRAMLQASGDEMFGVYGHCPEAFKAFLHFYRPLKYGGALPGFDHGAGHPLLLLYGAKAPLGKNSNYFNGL
jgi:hypothetical protein